MHDAHHPDHHIGEDGNPNSRQNEGEHEEPLPTRLSTVWDGEEQQEEQRPRQQPFHFAADATCRRNASTTRETTSL